MPLKYEPLDYDPEPLPAAEPDAAPAGAIPEPEEIPATVIPKAPEIPKYVFEADQKPEPKVTYEPLDYDPQPLPEPTADDKGSFIPEAIKGAASGAVETTGSMIEGLGGIRVENMQSRLEQEARAKEIAKMQEEGIMPEGSIFSGGIVNLQNLPPDQAAKIKARLDAATKGVEQLDLANDPFFKAGLATNEWSQENFTAAKDYEDSWTRNITSGLGSIVPYVAASAVPGIGPLAGIGAGYAGATGEAIDRAVKGGATKEQLLQAIRLGGLPGLTDQASVEVLLEKIPLPAAGKVLGVLGKIAAKAFVEGGQEGVQQVMQNMIEKYVYDPDQDVMEGVAEAAGIGAIVGGVVGAPSSLPERKPSAEDKETEHDTADPVLEEGVPEPPADAGQATPGGVGAAVATPPANTPTVTPEAAATPVTTTPQVDPAVGAALGATPAAGAGPANYPAASSDVELETNVGIEEDDAGAAALAAATRDMYAREAAEAAKDAQETAANTATVVAANTDEVAALNATVKKGQRRKAQQETVGTGAALTTPIVPPGQQPAATPTAPEAVAPGMTPSPPVLPAAPVAAANVPPTPPAAAAPTTRDERREKLLAGAPAGIREMLGAPAPAAAPEIPVEPAVYTSEDTGADAEGDVIQAIDAARAAGTNITLTPLDYEPAPIPAEGAAAPVVEGAKGAAVRAVKAKKEKAPKEPKPPKEKKPKAEAAKQVGKKEPAAAPAEVVRREDVAAWVAAPQAAATAPAATGEAAAPQTKMTRDAAAFARAHPRLQKGAASDAHDFVATSEEVAAEVLHKHGRQGRSPREIIEGHVDEIVAEIERRAAPVGEQVREEQVAAETKREKGLDRTEAEAAAERKKQEMATTTVPQKKERAGKHKGKSPEGILKESPDSVMREEARQKEELPEDQRDQRVMEYANLQREMQKKETTPERKREIATRQKELQESRAEARRAELAAKEAAPKELTPEAKERQAKVKGVIEAVPSPPATGTLHQQEQAWKANLLKFVSAAKGIKTRKNITRGNSNEENLLIWAKRLVADLKDQKKSEHFADIYADGVAEYQMARYFQEQGNTEELLNLLGTEKIKGEEYQEGAIGGEDTDISEQLDDGLAVARIADKASGPATDLEGGGGQLAVPEALERASDRKGGARGATKRWYSRAVRVASRNYGAQTNVPVNTARGVVNVDATITTGNKILDDIKAAGNEDLKDADKMWGSFMSFFRDMHLKKLRDMVGNMQVLIVSDADMTRIMGKPGTAGVHMGYSNAAVAAGLKSFIVLNESHVSTDAEMAHVAMHELTHAATVQAYKMNVRGTQAIIRRLREGVLKELRDRGVSDQELDALDLSYGLLQDSGATADLEFIAEAFSNFRFQSMLAQFNVSPSVARDISALATKGRLPTWWEAFTAGVSNAIGMIRGQRGQTYMEQMVAVYPHIMRSLAMQERVAATEVSSASVLPRAVAHGPTDVLQFNAEFKQRFEGVTAKFNSGWPTVKTRGMANMASTTGQLQRKAAAIMGGFTNPFNKLAELVHKKDPLRKAYRAMGQPVEDRVIRFAKKNPKAYKAMSKFLHESARLRIDPRHPRSHENNKGISKEGARSEQQRAMHEKMAKEWATMSPEAKALVNEIDTHYRKMHDMDSEKTIKLAFTNVFKAHHKDLPAGKTIEDAVEWVRSGAAARKLEERTAEDVQWHKALGNTAETLAAVPHLRRLQGIYVPLSRRGKFFISGWEKLAKPAKAIIDPSVKGDNKNKFIFSNEKDAREYMASTEYLAKLTSRWIDPTTGGKIEGGKEGTYTKPDGTIVYPKQQFFVTVQNSFMMMDDHQGKLDKHAEKLRKAGHHVKASALTQEHVDRGGGDIATVEMQALLRNVKGTTIGSNTIGQQAVQNALLEAQIRAMTSPGALSHHLRQKGVLGYSEDLALAMREYNRDMASHLANMDLAPQMSAADKELDDFVEARRDTAKGQDLIALQQLQSELHSRIKDKHFTSDRDGMGGRLFSAAMNITYMRHLFSPHYTILQALQPLMTTYPILAGKYGEVAAWREMKRFYAMSGGIKKALGKGIKESAAAALNLNPLAEQRVTPEELAGINVHDKHWLNAVAGEPDGAELQDLLLDVVAQGMGASSGIEASTIAQQDMGSVERGIQRLQNVAKGLPEAAEGINRAGAAIMTYRLSRAAGNSHEEAKAEAVNAVEQTQGGYSRANSPWFFNHPVLKFPLQFRRYGLMYAQMYYGNIAKLVAPSSDTETRKLAAKTLARLSATTFLFAGIGGLPLAEVARTMINAAVLLGWKEEDWEKEEGDIQQWFSSMLGWASGSEGLGDKMSEAAMHGLTRLVGADTSSTMGADNLLTFGQPKTLDEEGTAVWLVKMAMGASGKTVLDTYHAVADLDASALPWPKIMQNIMDAIELTTVGTVNPTTGEQYMEPAGILEGIIKGTGFKSASEAEQYEPGGGGYEGKQEKRLRWQRRQLMERWSNADGDERDRIRDEAREFSERQTDPRMRIDSGDLYRSRNERIRQRRERERKREGAY